MLKRMPQTHSDNIRWLCFAFTFLLNAWWLYSLSDRFLIDPDTQWHVKIGSEIGETWQFPRTDTYSHTFFGQPWVAKDWLSQIILYLTYRVGGWNLIVTLAVFCISLTGALIYYFLS